MFIALASVAQLIGALSCISEVCRLTPGQGTHLGCGFDP